MSVILPTRLTGLPDDELSFATAESGLPYCCWKEGNLLRLGVFSGGGWTFLADRSTAVEGKNLRLFEQSLAIDGDGNPHISYLSSGVLRHSWWDGVVWHEETVYNTSLYSVLSAALTWRHDAMYLFMATNDRVKTELWLFKKPTSGSWSLLATMDAQRQDLGSIRSRLKVVDQDLCAFWTVKYGSESWIGHAFYNLVGNIWRYRPLKRVNFSVVEGEITGLDFVAEDVDWSSSSSMSSTSSISSSSVSSWSTTSQSSVSSWSTTSQSSSMSVSSLSSFSSSSSSSYDERVKYDAIMGPTHDCAIYNQYGKYSYLDEYNGYPRYVNPSGCWLFYGDVGEGGGPHYNMEDPINSRIWNGNATMLTPVGTYWAFVGSPPMTWGDVVVKVHSTLYDDLSVIGLIDGGSGYNGIYVFDSIVNGQPMWKHVSATSYVVWDSGHYYLSTTVSGAGAYNDNPGLNPLGTYIDLTGGIYGQATVS